MKFEIIPVGDDAGFICDLVWPKRPGSPTVGTGRTELEAMMAFFARLTTDEFSRLKEETGSLPWSINGEVWKDFGAPR